MSKEEQRQKNLERIKALRLMDDNFMNVCLDKNKEAAELILKIVLGREDLSVIEVNNQKEIDNLIGRGVVLDVLAIDTLGNNYDIEIQRSDSGAIPRRARFHSSIIDVNMLMKGESFSELCENYVIFINENDVLGMNKPVYVINRFIDGENVQFEDGSHIIYVNASMKSPDTPLGRLMSDFYCTNADQMNYKVLADIVRYYKETEEGVDKMCEIWEEVKNDVRIENAKKMINDSVLPIEKIAEYTGLSIEQVRELAGNKSA